MRNARGRGEAVFGRPGDQQVASQVAEGSEECPVGIKAAGGLPSQLVQVGLLPIPGIEQDVGAHAVTKGVV